MNPLIMMLMQALGGGQQNAFAGGNPGFSENMGQAGPPTGAAPPPQGIPPTGSTLNAGGAPPWLMQFLQQLQAGGMGGGNAPGTAYAGGSPNFSEGGQIAPTPTGGPQQLGGMASGGGQQFPSANPAMPWMGGMGAGGQVRPNVRAY